MESVQVLTANYVKITFNAPTFLEFHSMAGNNRADFL